MGYIQIQLILDELTDNPLLKGLTVERVVNYTQQLIRKAGSPKLFEDKTTIIHIKDFRAELPCDFVDIIGVRCLNGKAFMPASDTFFMSHTLKRPDDKPCDNRFIKEDLMYELAFFDVANIEISEDYVNSSELSDDDKAFLQRHPEIKNKLLYVMIKKLKEEGLQGPPPPLPRLDKFIITELDLFGLDPDILELVKRILNAFYLEHHHRCIHKYYHNNPHHKGKNFDKDLSDYFTIKTSVRKEYGWDNTDHTYKIQGNFIFTSVNDMDIEISYRSIATDVDGFPLVYDDESFIEALKAYIKVKCYTIEFDLGRISAPVLLNALTEYAWYVGLALTSLVRLGFGEMEALTRLCNTLVMKTTLFDSLFRTLNNREYLRKH